MQRNNTRKWYAACPICGRKLCKAENGSAVEILCPRCSNLVRIEIKNEVIHVFLLEKE